MIVDVQLEIQREMNRARQLHPNGEPGKRDAVRSAAILAEEAGEVLQAALNMTQIPPDAIEPRHLLALYVEVVQTAAMATMWLENFEITRREYLPKRYFEKAVVNAKA